MNTVDAIQFLTLAAERGRVVVLAEHVPAEKPSFIPEDELAAIGWQYEFETHRFVKIGATAEQIINRVWDPRYD